MESTFASLAEPFDMSLPAITKHLKVLERAGLITRGREAQWRPARLDPAPFREISEWTERYRQFWDESYQRLDAYLNRLQSEDKQEQKPHESDE